MRHEDICPHCKRPYPAVDGLTVRGPVRTQLVKILRTRPHGMTVHELRDHLYGGALDAPDSRNIINVHISIVNKQLRPQGYEIRALSRGPGSRYVLQPFKG